MTLEEIADDIARKHFTRRGLEPCLCYACCLERLNAFAASEKK